VGLRASPDAVVKRTDLITVSAENWITVVRPVA